MPERRTDRARYPSHRAQVKNARHRAERCARDWGLSAQTVADVVSVVDELVANAVTHAQIPRGREVGVTLRLLESLIRIEVRDADPTRPEIRKPYELTDSAGLSELPEAGRGLWLVESLCQQWGSTEEVIGKTVWADIPLTPKEVLSC